METLIPQLEERRRQAQESIVQFEEIERHIADREDDFFPYLTLKCGIAHARANLQWAEDALQELNRRLPPEPPHE